MCGATHRSPWWPGDVGTREDRAVVGPSGQDTLRFPSPQLRMVPSSCSLSVRRFGPSVAALLLPRPSSGGSAIALGCSPAGTPGFAQGKALPCVRSKGGSRAATTAAGHKARPGWSLSRQRL